ncbi:MAG: hypothetical protein F6J95_002975 [Leptolyngbya sp. SIO1E4]|nr:hypothetical protein [Leptolyngbya sp. SIO1E4]
MFSFRRDQFRAIFLGVLIADALSYRRLPWGVPASFEGGQRAETMATPFSSAIASDRWCREMIRSLCLPLEKGPLRQDIPLESGPTAGEKTDPGSQGIEAMLATLPLFLQELDPPDSTFPSWVNPNSQTSPAAVLTFHQGMAALLNANIALARKAWIEIAQMGSSSQNPEAGLISLAFEQVFLADGDFGLTLGQSLHSPSELPGLPILSGILSACWVGSRGIPVRWYQALITPPATLQAWLQQRWQIPSIQRIETGTEGLWHRWLGSDASPSRTRKNTAYPVVQPVI